MHIPLPVREFANPRISIRISLVGKEGNIMESGGKIKVSEGLDIYIEEEEGAILFESVCDSRKRKRWVKKRRGGRWLPVNGTKNHANLLSLGKAFRFDPSSCHVPFHLYPSECLACHLMHTRICIRSLLFICRYLLCLL